MASKKKTTSKGKGKGDGKAPDETPKEPVVEEKPKKTRSLGQVIVQIEVDVKMFNAEEKDPVFSAWQDFAEFENTDEMPAMDAAHAWLSEKAEPGTRYRCIRAKDPVEIKIESVRRIVG